MSFLQYNSQQDIQKHIQQYIPQYIIDHLLRSKKTINEIKQNIDKIKNITDKSNIYDLIVYYNKLNFTYQSLYSYLNEEINKNFNVLYKKSKTIEIDKTKKYICLRYSDIYPIKIFLPKKQEIKEEDTDEIKEIKRELNENIDFVKIDENIYYNASIIRSDYVNYFASQCPFKSDEKEEDDICFFLKMLIDNNIHLVCIPSSM